MIEFIKSIEGNVKFMMILFWVLFVISVFFASAACDETFKIIHKYNKQLLALSIALFLIAVIITNFYIYFYCQTLNT